MPASSISCTVYTAQGACFAALPVYLSILIVGPSSCVDMQVTLLIPWLNQEDQAIVFHSKFSFHAPEQQTECIKDWLRKRTGFEPQCQIQYYPGRYDTRLLGIFPVGDLTVYIPAEKVRLYDSSCKVHGYIIADLLAQHVPYCRTIVTLNAAS